MREAPEDPSTIVTSSSSNMVALSGYTVSIDQANINMSNRKNISFTVHGNIVGAKYDYSFVSSGGGSVTGTGIATSVIQNIREINLMALKAGTVILSYVMSVGGDNGSSGRE